jgi:SAM-dependent methyltransferase
VSAPDLDSYAERLRTTTTNYAGPFWAAQLAGFRRALASDADVDQLVELLGYGFREGSNAGTIQEALDLLKPIRKNRHMLLRIRRHAGKELYEHAAAIAFLQSEDVLDDYRADITSLGVASDMSTARHWWYARHLDRLAPPGALDILEIGAGAGNLAVLLHQRRRVSTYTIIDLPEMLLAAAATLAKHTDAAVDLGPDTNAQYRLLNPAEADAVEPGRFDLACNYNSFMEMDRDQRDAYIELVYRTTRPGGLFVNVNRRQANLPLPDGSTWDNNPLLYPYRHDDRIIAWEDEPFQTVTRNKLFSRPSLAVLFAAQIA